MSVVKTRIACQEFRERLQLYTRILQDDGQGGQETIDNRCIGEVWGYVHRPHFTVLDTGTGEGQVITQGFDKKYFITYNNFNSTRHAS